MLLTFLYLLYRVVKSCGPTSTLINKAYTQKNDDVATMLSRIQWANQYNSKVSIFTRLMVQAIVIAFLVCLVLLNKLPSGIEYLRILLVILFVLFTTHSFIDFHADKFIPYAINSNVSKIRRKLKLNTVKYSDLSEQKTKFSPTHECFRFNYDF